MCIDARHIYFCLNRWFEASGYMMMYFWHIPIYYIWQLNNGHVNIPIIYIYYIHLLYIYIFGIYIYIYIILYIYDIGPSSKQRLMILTMSAAWCRDGHHEVIGQVRRDEATSLLHQGKAAIQVLSFWDEI